MSDDVVRRLRSWPPPGFSPKAHSHTQTHGWPESDTGADRIQDGRVDEEDEGTRVVDVKEEGFGSNTQLWRMEKLIYSRHRNQSEQLVSVDSRRGFIQSTVGPP